MERTVLAGTFYRHFKDKLYQIMTVAYHSETGEPMVVYQALYGDYRTYVRPLDMFLSEVDREKYPDCPQQYRFEQVELRAADAEHIADAEHMAGAEHIADTTHTPGTANPEHTPHITPSANTADTTQPNRYLLQFLEAETLTAKLEVLDLMKGRVTTAELESICMTLDISTPSGDPEEQIEGIRKVLRMRQHYDGSRLRSS